MADNTPSLADSLGLAAADVARGLIARGMQVDGLRRDETAGDQPSALLPETRFGSGEQATSKSLAVDTERLIDGDIWFKRLTTKSGDSGAMRHGLSHLKLPPAILYHLSAARAQRPLLYRHLLSVAVISHYLALRLRLKPAAIDAVLTAALCHDIGELYTDPGILDAEHRVTADERHFIDVHPLTAWLIVRELPGLDPEVARAVLQHHERLDGCGYPNGVKDEAIGLGGRILAAADVSASIMARRRDHRRLSTLLRLNDKKYDRKVVALLHDAITQEQPFATQFEADAAAAKLAGFAALLDGWSRLRADSTTARTALVVFLSDRMYNLRTVILDFGFDPDSLEICLALAKEDATIAAELLAVIDELQFLLADLAREMDRRLPDWLAGQDPLAALALGDWQRLLGKCIDG